MATNAFFNILGSFFMRVGFQGYESDCFLSVANFNACDGFFGRGAKQGGDWGEKKRIKKAALTEGDLFRYIT
ncbi:hypothetical protein [Pectobacterium aquaticum]|uniref:hypothetical protein n=1 Tax=Pectobacterium aquaticum TaxID=2204145 RepID=UPI001D015436|nr:hypothetical protein [Pectobacterium aquaticum]